MPVPRRWVLALAAGLAGVALAAVLLRPAPTPVEVAVVRRAPLRVTVDEEGRTRVVDRFLVAAPVTGRVARIALEAGDSVRAGQVVATLVPQPLDPRSEEAARARLEAALDAGREAEAAVREARAARDQAERDLARAERLAAAGSISAQQLESARLDAHTKADALEAADFRAQSAAHDAEAARAQLLASDPAGGRAPTVAVRSPVAGRILRVPEPSERVVPVGTTLVEVGDPGRLEVYADLLSEDAVRVQPGQPMLVENWGGPGALRARVRRVEPSGFTKVSALGVEEQRVRVVGDFDTLPPGLGDGFRVDVRVVLWSGDSVVQVPSTALFREGERWQVFGVRGGRARRVDLELGHRAADAAEVRHGLALGDTVVRQPSDRLTDGTRVKPAPPPP